MKIEDHKFDDKQVNLQRLSNENCLWFTNENKEVFISKGDVIAMAKHFNITEQDLIDNKTKKQSVSNPDETVVIIKTVQTFTL